MATTLMDSISDHDALRIKLSPGLGGYAIYDGYAFLDGAFLASGTARSRLATIRAQRHAEQVTTSHAAGIRSASSPGE